MKSLSLKWLAAGWLAVVMTSLTVANAAVRTPAVFGSGMVLQRDMPVPVWGWGEPGEEVTVTFRDQSQSTKTDADGKWIVKLAPLSVGEPADLTVKGQNTLTFKDVLVGEVWICSGQSNMQWSVNSSLDPDLEKAAANHPQIRLFAVPLTTADTPQEDVIASWQPCNPQTLGNFTAVGYYFGRQLYETLHVPVGIIQTAWGGTRAEAWTSPEMMAKSANLAPIQESWNERLAAPANAAATAEYEPKWKKWQEDWKAARIKGEPAPGRPGHPQNTRWSEHHPSTLYNAMVAPLAPYAIRGAIWYQGESNAGRAYQYRELMPAMIQSWRDAWGQGDFPFYQVQLANFFESKDQPAESAWAELREAQHMAAKALPNVDAACIIDAGAAKDIHPKDKQVVGKRLARLALVDVYQVPGIIRQGPTFESVQFDGNKAIVKFDTHGSKLISYYGEPLKGFALAGEDKNFVWGEAKITGPDTVEIVAAGIEKPASVRYNWADNPKGTLYSEAYLPAYPFRSDSWDGVTVKNVRAE
ncbi:sialate O-acetylesterase [Planctomicrobium sp. SH661]|uniref:sialate O-acetylesterase n=1 Tax=Planctomicrobium sp. SH661 TaxID=3448124 RepID=UPI003F5C81A2